MSGHWMPFRKSGAKRTEQQQKREGRTETERK